MRKLIGKPERLWIITVAIASVLLLATLFVPLWKMELVAPQYPEGLVMKAYGYKFAEDPGSYYDDIREINGLNHYIGMKPIEEVTEMSLFIPGVIGLVFAAVATAFVTWKRKWLKALVIFGFFATIMHTIDESILLTPGNRSRTLTPRTFGAETMQSKV